MIIALIPARSGSKRLPGKNLKLFSGRPLLEWSIDVALRARRVERCFVSTEDGTIASIARAAGAEVIDRPAELASDTATTASVARHAVAMLDAAGLAPRCVVTLQPTSPLRPVWVVDRAIDLFEAEQADSVLSVTRSHQKRGEVHDGVFVPEYAPGTRSQDMPVRYYENGVVYVSRASMLRETGDFFGRRMIPFEIDALYALGDIDEAIDFEVAEYIYRNHPEHFTENAQERVHT